MAQSTRAPSPDTQAILLLCAYLPGQEQSAVRPLSPAQYRDVSRVLHQQELRPGDFLADKGQTALDNYPDHAIRERLRRLLERGTALALALERWGQTGIWVLSRADAEYPELLRQQLGRLAPPILYGAGPRDLLQEGGVAIVGSRNADERSLEFARGLGERCAREGLTVISGGARGVDSEATLTCLNEGGNAVAVLADSLAKAAVAKKYREHLADGRLLLLSPYSPHASFNVGNAMGRNKYLYILADVAVVVHTGPKGGTWEGAHENLKRNWAPLLVYASDDPNAANQELLRTGGHPIPHSCLTLDASIFEILKLRLPEDPQRAETDSEGDLSEVASESSEPGQMGIPLPTQPAESPSTPPRVSAREDPVQPTTARHPREGMQARIRNRRGLIASVEPYDAHPEGRLHLVRIEYTDRDGSPEDTVIWEREPGATVLEPHALPKVDEQAPMPPRDFDALVRATRWNSLTPFLKPDGSGERSELPIAAPFFGAVQVDDFQLVPLLQALQMPRVSLLLADDVGLGKTIEAGLILTELLIRRRIRRVLVITPASLRNQWRAEMHEKFSLSFDVIDRAETHALQKQLGLDANPWRTFPRIITSYYYLRQPDVLEQFLATCRAGDDDTQLAQLPWDLLIVDEAHNLMPSNFGDDSDLAKMLREITPFFEHKLFLTATPHNGHTRCFSGLLEQLDPVRFTQKSEFTEDEKERVKQVVVRRLKSEINDLDDKAGRPRRFPYRELTPLELGLSTDEKTLSATVETLRKRVKALVRSAGKRGEELAGNFAVEILSKRLLSSPATFAESWFRLKLGLAEDEKAEAQEVSAAKRAAEEEIDDDLEREGRAQHAARTIGAWLQPLLGDLETEIAAVDKCLADLGLEPGDGSLSVPKKDARFDRLVELIENRLRADTAWRNDERLIIFTEYKTTLDNLEARLKKHFQDDGQAIQLLYGGMSAHEREPIQEGFNDPDASVRVLIATDAASEGLNLQKTARYVLHYEIPWNPSRLEQRNGRLDRHGQARDVEVFHFTSEDDADLRFIAHVVDKVHNIREDLGSMGEVFDGAFQRRFLDDEDAETVIKDLDHDVKTQEGTGQVERQETEDTGDQYLDKLRDLCQEIDLSPDTLRDTLEVALGWGFGQPRLEGPDQRGRLRLVQPLPPRWETLIDDSLRLDTAGASRGALPKLIFDPKLFIETNGGRPVFRSSNDTTLLHLGHPMFHQALAQFAQARYPGGSQQQATRWALRHGEIPGGADALLLLTVEELAVNELREPLHQWVRTLRIPVKGDKLGETLPHQAPTKDSGAPIPPEEFGQAKDYADNIWLDLRNQVRRRVREHQETLSVQIRAILETAGKEALAEETQRFKSRLSEVEKAMQETSLTKLEKERDKLLDQMQQLVISQEQKRSQETELRNLEDELARRRSRYQELLDLLRKDQQRVLERMLPRRYSLPSDSVQVYPVAVEIRLPEARS